MSDDATGSVSGGFDADVVIIGCGPVGVMLALRCVQQGLSVIAIDSSTEVYPLPRAIGMDSEIQRLFATAGLDDLVRSVSTPLEGAEFVDRDLERIVGFDLPPGTLDEQGFPPMTMFEQPLLEQGLREAAVAAGVDMRLGVSFEAVSQDHHGVIVGVVDPDGASSLWARWMVGADGARSSVRKACAIDFVDQGFDQEWLVVDTTLVDAAVDLPRVARQVCDPEQVVTIVPGHADRRRWEIQFRSGDDSESMLDPDHIRVLLSRWVRPDQIRIDRTAVYRFHALVADQFRHGRVFLAGDACHQMPPFNGQGMNTGLRDADNLSWKLAMVADGRCGPELLDTYEVERLPHAESQVLHSADAGRLIDALAAGEDFDTAAGYGGGRPFPHLTTGIRLGDHPSVGRPVPRAMVAGQPLDVLLGDCFGLVARAEPPMSDETSAFWDRLGASVVGVGDALGPLLADGDVAVVRPDRYIAAVTDDLDHATEALSALLYA